MWRRPRRLLAELDTFLAWNEAKNLKEFQQGLQLFDVGSQNWVYADKAGNMAYFASAEMPIRSDLQQGTVAPGSLPGIFPPDVPVPPWFIRDGTSGAHEWLPVQNPQPGQAIPYEILRQDELPQTINPPAGWFVNANNDPAGTVLDNNPLNQLRTGGEGIYYLNPGYAGGFRAGTITRRIRDYVASQGELSKEDLQSIQADVSLLDARFFVPYIGCSGHAGRPGERSATLRSSWQTEPVGLYDPDGFTGRLRCGRPRGAGLAPATAPGSGRNRSQCGGDHLQCLARAGGENDCGRAVGRPSQAG